MKAYAYVAALIVLAGVVGYGIHIVKKANRVDAAEARADAVEKGRAADMSEVGRRIDAVAVVSASLVARLDGISARFDSLKIPEPGKLIVTKEIPGACPVSSVSDQFIGVWNNASQPGPPTP